MIAMYAIAGYILIGIIFSVFFLSKGINAIDETAQGSPWTFKLMILPGCIIFWPVLLKKYLRALKGYRHD